MPEARARLTALVAVFLANTVYLTAFASPTPFYFANVVLHILLGLVLAAAVGRGLWRTFRELSAVAQVGWVVLAAGSLVGLVIVMAGAAGRFRWLLPTHIVLTSAGLAVIGANALVAGFRA